MQHGVYELHVVPEDHTLQAKRSFLIYNSKADHENLRSYMTIEVEVSLNKKKKFIVKVW